MLILGAQCWSEQRCKWCLLLNLGKLCRSCGGDTRSEMSPTAPARFCVSPLLLSSGAAQAYCDYWHILQGKSQRKLSPVMNSGKCHLHLGPKQPKIVENKQPFITGAVGPCALAPRERTAFLHPSKTKATIFKSVKFLWVINQNIFFAPRIITRNTPKDRWQFKGQDSFRLSAALYSAVFISQPLSHPGWLGGQKKI